MAAVCLCLDAGAECDNSVSASKLRLSNHYNVQYSGRFTIGGLTQMA